MIRARSIRGSPVGDYAISTDSLAQEPIDGDHGLHVLRVPRFAGAVGTLLSAVPSASPRGVEQLDEPFKRRLVHGLRFSPDSRPGGGKSASLGRSRARFTGGSGGSLLDPRPDWVTRVLARARQRSRG
jgi:hypothetical protein